MFTSCMARWNEPCQYIRLNRSTAESAFGGESLLPPDERAD